jgi:hypothetical protein
LAGGNTRHFAVQEAMVFEKVQVLPLALDSVMNGALKYLPRL